MNIQVGEEVEAQYVSVEGEEQLTEAPLAALQDNGNNSNSLTCSDELEAVCIYTVFMLCLICS